MLFNKKSEDEIIFDLCAPLRAISGIYSSKKSIDDKIRLVSIYIKDFDKKMTEKKEKMVKFYATKNMKFDEVLDKQSIYSEIVNTWIVETNKKCIEYFDKIGVDQKDRKERIMKSIGNKKVPPVSPTRSHRKDYSYSSSIARKNTI